MTVAEQARTLTAAGRKVAVRPGMFLTDGRRLVEVRRVEVNRVICEEGSVEAPDILSLSLADVSHSWRRVTPDADAA